ncbi:hypothetical protein FS837_004604 [Tulasnella sp. UAMH 9824]|nr:hypothetical protein FS837_004604 [Tulasnella sp. UAMH 9824]
MESPFIDLLPTELLEQVICLGLNDHDDDSSRIRWACMWREVSRRWKNVIDGCPSLWSSIVIKEGTKHVEPLLEKSKGAPLEIQILSDFTSLDEDLIQLLVDHAHRWSSLVLYAYFEQFVARLGSSPSTLDTLELQFTTISHDCKLFNLIRPNLRKLSLGTVTIPHTFDPTLGLEELYLYDVYEPSEDGRSNDLSINKFYQFLLANPNLRILQHEGGADTGPNDRSLQTCVEASFTVHTVTERPPPSAWTTFVHALKRVEEFVIHVGDGSLSITAVAGPCTVDLFLDHIKARDGNSEILACSMLEDILDEAERDTPNLAYVGLALLGPNYLEVLKLIQTPVFDSSLGRTRWRIPNLDTIMTRMYKQDLSYRCLQAFVQARSSRCCIHPASPITGIFARTMPTDRQENVLDRIMAYNKKGTKDKGWSLA